MDVDEKREKLEEHLKMHKDFAALQRAHHQYIVLHKKLVDSATVSYGINRRECSIALEALTKPLPPSHRKRAVKFEESADDLE